MSLHRRRSRHSELPEYQLLEDVAEGVDDDALAFQLSGLPDYFTPWWREPLGKWRALQKLQFFQLITALAHAFQFIAVIASSNAGYVKLIVPYYVWPKRDAPYQGFTYKQYAIGNYRIDVAIYVFFLLSFTYQFFASQVFFQSWAQRLLVNYTQPWRWAEYSISASLMATIFAVLSNVTDLTFIYVIFAGFFTVMLLGYAQERVMAAFKHRESEDMYRVELVERIEYNIINSRKRRDTDNDTLEALEALKPPAARKISWLRLFGLHFLGWVLFAAITSTFAVRFVMATRGGAARPPTWVYGLYAAQLLIFASFGLTQLVQQFMLFQTTDVRKCQTIALGTEAAYTVLSLAAKSVLGWVLYAELLAEKNITYPTLTCILS